MAGQRWKRVRRGLLIGLVALAVVAVLLLASASCRPAWYRPAALDYRSLRQDKADLANVLDAIGDALNTGRPAVLVIDQEQVNRLLVARHEVWPQADWSALQFLSDPQIALFETGVIRLGATVQARGWRGVAWCDLHPHATRDTLQLRFSDPRLGVLPIPIGALGDALRRELERSGGAARDARTVDFINDWTWPNGKRRFQLQSLRFERGRLHLTLTPR